MSKEVLNRYCSERSLNQESARIRFFTCRHAKAFSLLDRIKMRDKAGRREEKKVEKANIRGAECVEIFKITLLAIAEWHETDRSRDKLAQKLKVGSIVSARHVSRQNLSRAIGYWAKTPRKRSKSSSFRESIYCTVQAIEMTMTHAAEGSENLLLTHMVNTIRYAPVQGTEDLNSTKPTPFF